MQHPILYEINTRCWLKELSRSAGRRFNLAQVPEEQLAKWTDWGITHIWLMGIWSTGDKGREHALHSRALRQEFDEALPGWTRNDVGGSPYAVTGYRVSRNLGGDAALKKFRQRLHQHGMKLVLDFVPNHVALDHPWVTEHPERFVQCDTIDARSFIGGSQAHPVRLCHGCDPYFDPWTDTAQLDLRRSDTRKVMVEELKSIASRCDGVRCDMAMLLINEIFNDTWQEHPSRADVCDEEFWPQAIRETRKVNEDFVFLAEAYWDREHQLVEQGFDFAYHKPFTDAVLARRESVQHEVLRTRPWIYGAAHFLENHDEHRVAAQLGPDIHRAAAVAQLSLPGMRFLHEGQLDGWKIKTPVQLANRVEEPTDPEISAMYRELLNLLNTTGVGTDDGRVLNAHCAWDGNDSHKFFLLVQWQTHADHFHLVVVNFAAHRSQCYASLEIENLARHHWTLTGLLAGETYQREGEELQARGLFLDVGAFAVQCFEFKPNN